MFSYRNERVTVLLFTLAQSFFLASAASIGMNNVNFWNEENTRFRQDPGINGAGVATKASLESSCTKELEAYSSALDAQERWARKMSDASTKMQSGILEGNDIDLGMYGQCLEVDGSYNNVRVQGKHCMVIFSHDSGTLITSVCLPSSCDERHALEMGSSSALLPLANRSLGMELHATRATCASTGHKEFQHGEILVVTLLSLIVVFMLSCTVCDFVKSYWHHETPSAIAVHKLARFSLYKNILALLDTKVEPGPTPVISALRFLSICFIVALNQRESIMIKPMINASQLTEWKYSWTALWFNLAMFAADNFFVMSGFFVSYLFFKKMQSGVQFNLPSIYFHRYLRMIPSITVVSLFVGFVYHRIGSGPIWEMYVPMATAACHKNWWMNLFFIQNFEPEICIPQSWFSAADMQMFVVSPIILYPLYRWPKHGLGIWGVCLLSTIVTPALLKQFPIEGARVDLNLVAFFARAFPYLVGMILAYDIVMKKRQLTKAMVRIGWFGSCVTMILSCLAMQHLTTSKDNLAYETACAALLRQSWSMAMGWVIYASIQGYGGFFARILSTPIFLPLGRITPCIFLTHVSVIYFRYGSTTVPGIFEEGYLFQDWITNLLLSMVMAVLLYLFVETPAIIVENILEPRPTNQKEVEAMQSATKEAEEESRNSPENLSQSVV